MKIFYLVTLFFSFISCAYGQLSDVHYLPPLKQGGNNQAIRQQAYYLSTPETTAFNVDVFQGTNAVAVATINISNTLSGKYNVSDGDNNISLVTNANTGIVLSTSGLRFQSQGGQEFYVNYRGRSAAQGASLTSKGRAAAGKSFKWGGIPNRGNQTTLTTSLGIMATEAGTTTIDLFDFDPATTFRFTNTVNGLTGASHQIQLQQYQTFVFESYKGTGTISPNIDGWLGASIQSDKEIVISNGGLNVGVRTGAGGRDAGIDQPVPENVLGKEYVFIRGNGTNETEFPIIIATTNNTEIFVNNSPVAIATIDEGEYYEVSGANYSTGNAGGNMYVTTSNAAYAYQCLTGGNNLYYTIGLNFIAPVNCLLPDVMDNIPDIRNVDDLNYNGGITIVSANLTNDSDIQVTDDSGTNTHTFSSVSTSTWKSVYISGLTGDVKIESVGPIAVGFLGTSGAAGLAGYFSGFDTVPIVDIDITGGGCFPGSILKEITGGFFAYEWYKNNAVVTDADADSDPSTFDPLVTGVGDYFVRVTDFGGCIYDSATVTFYSCDPDIKIDKIDDVDPIDAGSNVTFTISAESFSINPVTGLTITDVLPTAFDLVSATPESGTTWSSPIWTIGTMNPGDKFELEIVAKAKDNASGTFKNEVTYNYNEIGSEANNVIDDLEEEVTINACNFADPPSSTPTLCVNTVLTDITHDTTVATGIGTPTGLPAGVNASWAANIITISGTPTASGIFNYDIPLTGGCNTVSATGTIAVNELPVAATITGLTSVCVNSTITLTEGTSGTIAWNSSAPGVATIDAVGEVTGLSTGTTDITYTVTDANGCTSLSSAAYTVTVNPLPVFSSLTTNSPICEGEDAEFYVTGTPSTRLTYSIDAGASQTVDFDASGDVTIVNSTANTDTTVNLLSLEYIGTGCSISVTNSDTITVNPNPNLISAEDLIECIDDPIQTLDANNGITFGGNVSVVWYDATTGGNVVANPTINTVNTPTSFYAELTDTTTSCINPIREEILLHIVSPPFPDFIEEACSSEVLDIAIGSFSTTYTVSSSDPANVPPAADRTTAMTANITDTYVNTTPNPVDITYTVSIVTPTACAGEEFEVIVTIHPESDGGIVSADQKICTGDTPADISVSGIIGSVVEWQQSTSAVFSSFTDIAVTNTTLTGVTIGSLTQSAYFRAVIQSGTCSNVNSPVVAVNVDTAEPIITGTIPAETVEGCLASDVPTALTTVAALEGVGLTINDDFTTDANLVVTSNDVSVVGTCPNILMVTRTYTVTDECNNAVDVSQTITVEDTIAPTWTTTTNDLDRTLECSDTAGVNSAQALFPVATDLCDADVTDIVKVSGAFVADAACSQAGTYTNTWTVVDDCDNTSVVYTQVITIEDTTTPTWTTAVNDLDRTIECSDTAGLNAAQALFPVATDLCDNDVTDIVKVSGFFVLNGSCNQSGTYTNTWTVADDCTNTSVVYTQVITIEDTTAPTWTTAVNDLDRTLECSDTAGVTSAQALFPVATDLCDSDVTDIVKVSGAFAADAACSQAGTYTNTWTVADDCSNTSVVYTQVITIEDTSAPTWDTASNALDTTLECSDTAGLTSAQALFPTATDLCDSDVTDVVKVSGAFVAYAACSQAGTYTNTWTVADDCTNTSVVYTQVITIEDTTAPTWTTAVNDLDRTLECNDTAGITSAQALFPVATDLCDSDVTDIVKVSGAFVADATCSQAGTYTNTWTVQDDCLNTSVVYTQVITIEDTTAPTWDTAANALDTTLECSDTAGLTAAQALFPTATDLCDTDVTDIVKVSGFFVLNGSCNQSGTYTNTWTVADDCDNTSVVYTQVITIEDTTAPTWTTAVNDLDRTLECSDTGGLTSAQALFPAATDLCDSDVTDVVKVSGAFVADATCSQAGTYTNTWTVADDCTNTSVVYTQVITIEDTTAPTWDTASNALDTTLECSDTAGLTSAQALFPAATDLCDSDVTDVVKVSGAFVADAGCSQAGTYTNTWTVADDCTNTSVVYTQVITIEDTSAPTWTTAVNDLDRTLECNDTAGIISAQALFPVATDLCDSDVTDIVKVSGAFVADATCSQEGTYTNTWTVQDDCTNTSVVYKQVITIEDTTAPTGTAPEDITGLECIADVPAPDINLITDEADECMGAVTVTVTDTDNGGTACTGDPYIVTRTYTLEDCLGLATDLVQTITVENVTSPVVPSNNGSTVECIADAVQPVAPVVADVCGNNLTAVITENADPACEGNKVYTYTYTDCGNNISVYTYTYTIDRITLPVVPPNDASTVNDIIDAVQPSAPVITDVCGVAITPVITENVSPICDGQKIYTFTYRDCSGNQSVYTYTYTIDVTSTMIISNTATDTCSEVALNYDLTSLTTLPNVTFDWAVTPNTTISGAVNGTGTAITDTITNTSGGIQNVTYTVTPFNENGCEGPTFEVVVTISPQAELVVSKVTLPAADGAYDTLNEVVQYEITVENTNDVVVSNVSIADLNADMGSVSPANVASIPAFGSVTFTASHTITQADLDAGEVVNSATGSGTDPCGVIVTDDSDDPNTAVPNDDTVTSLQQNPSVSLEKTVTFNDENGDGFPQDGETLSYVFTIENTGNVTLSNIEVTDPLITVVGSPITLTPGSIEATTYFGTYILNQSVIDSGSITNSASVEGEDPSGGSVVDKSDDPANTTDVDANGDGEPDDPTVLELDKDPELTITKTGVFIDANSDGIAQVGETIQYTFDVSNTGNVTVSGITISDAIVSVTGGPITLVPLATDNTSFTATYILTQDDVNVGVVTNTATASGTAPDGSVITDDSDDPTTSDPNDATETTLARDPKLSLFKTAIFNDENGNGFPEVGETISYIFDVRNTGNVTITGISISDPLMTVIGGPINLDPAQTDVTTFTGNYALLLSDINTGSVTNSATVSGTNPDGGTVNDVSDDPANTDDIDTNGDGDPDDSTVFDLIPNPQLSLEKIGNFNDESNDGIAQVGETISYTFTVSNTGNVTISNINISDPLVTVSGGPISLDPTILDSTTFTAEYILTQADINNAGVVNSATTEGNTPDGGTVSDTSDDPNNTTNNDSNGDGEPDDTTNTTLPVSPEISLLKEVLPATDGSYDTLGEIINYELTVTNTGNVTLTNIVVSDANADSIIPATITSIAPNVSVTVLATHTITQVDLDAGSVMNSASVTGEDPFGNTAEDTSDDPNNPTDNDTNGDGDPDDVTTIGVDQNPSMSLEKIAVFNDENGDGIPQVNETLTYNFEVENTGNVTLSAISVTDPLVTVNGGPISLIPAEINDSAFFGTYVITQADIDAGSITNSATVNGQDPMGGSVTDTSDDPANTTDTDANGDGDPDDDTVTTLPSAPALRVFKTGIFIDGNSDGIAQAGETVSYIFDITNTGNVTLVNVSIADPLVGVAGMSITLIPGQTDSTTFTASYVLTQNDVDLGFVENTATGTGTAPDGAIVSDDSDDPTTTTDGDPTVTTLARDPELSLFKTAIFNDENGDGIPQVNETINYVFDVRNTGNVSLNNIEVTDPLVAVIGGPISLIPGGIDATTFTATYIILQADIDAGGITNSALAVGEDNDGSTITDVSDFSDDPDNPNNIDLNGDGDPDDPTVSDLSSDPSLNLNKIATFNDENSDGFAQSGETISYVFEVANTGNVSLINIRVTDPLVTVIGSPINLLPTQIDVTSFTAVYTLTQLDIDTGNFSNSATATGQDPNGNPVIDDSDDPRNPANVDNDNDGNPDDSTVTNFNTFSEITITKEALAALDGAYDTVGENLVYDIIVANTGDTTLTNVIITDTNADSISTSLIPLLNVGQVVMVEAIHILTQSDLDTGVVNNSANAAGVDPFGNDISGNSDDPANPTDQDSDGDGNPDDVTVTALDQQPSIRLAKTDDNAPDGLWDEVGELITYTLEVTNTGNVTLTNVVVSDANADAGSIVPLLITVLMPSETVILTASHTITQADLDFGSTTNSATVNAETPSGGNVMDTSDDPNDLTDVDINGDGDPDDATVTAIPQTASMIVDKTVDNSLFFLYGDVLTYTIQITNTGTVTLFNVSIRDPNADTIIPASIPLLGPNEVFTAIATHEITVEDFENGFVTNTAVVNALIPNSTELISEDSDDPNNTDNVDSDGDGDPDDPTISYLDPDPDNDGVFTSFEIDPNGDGSGPDDTDGDGIPDYLDADDDGDGILTVQEGSNPDGNGNPSDAFDSDGDGIPDYLEPNIQIITEDGIQVFNGFSPNGDGVNDVLVIKGLEGLENTVTIYNRWGVKVYETEDYGSDANYFRGISNGRVTVKETDELPVGTYYYLIEYVSELGGTKEQVGFIYINR